MSASVLAIVLETRVDHSSDKFILVSLANYADDNGVSCPSQARLQAETELDRKTVIACLERLAQAGFIRDTGLRTGDTKQVIIWKILGLPATSTIHYVYQVTDAETGEFYVGTRSSDCPPHLDPYLGSGVWIKKAKASRRPLVKKVLSQHATVGETVKAEGTFLREVEDDPLCRNEGTARRSRERAIKQHARFRPAAPVPAVPMERSQNRDALVVPIFPTKSPENGTVREAQFRDTIPDPGHLHFRDTIPNTGQFNGPENGMGDGGNPPIPAPEPRARGDSLYLVKKEEEETLLLGTGKGGKGKGGMGGKENPNVDILPTSQAKLVLDAWNEMATRSDLPCAKTITPKRRQRIRDRLREHGMDGIREAIERIDQSDFCHGANNRAWKADFDFLLQEDSLNCAREGRYDNRAPKLSMSQATGAAQILNQLRQKREAREYEQNNLLGAEPVA